MKQEEKQQYVSIGAKTLSKDIFRNVLRPLDNYSFKPSGGLWSSVHYEYMISEWLDYVLTSHQSLLYYKNMTIASIFTLKEDANILKVNTPEEVRLLERKYPSYHHQLGFYSSLSINESIFDFEALSKEYDGIYLNYYRIALDSFSAWSVNTLLLFNLDCIKSYKNFDITLPHTLEDFPIIQNESEELTIKDQSDVYKYLYNYTKILFNELMPNLLNITDYNNLWENITISGNKCIQIILKEKQKELQELKNLPEVSQTHIPEDTIARNITLNYLTEYLEENKNQINTLPKSPIKTKKLYKL